MKKLKYSYTVAPNRILREFPVEVQYLLISRIKYHKIVYVRLLQSGGGCANIRKS